MTPFNYLVDAQSAITIYSTSGADYTWTASDSGNSGLSPPAVAPQSFASVAASNSGNSGLFAPAVAPQSSASVEASLTPTSGPVIVTVKQADGIIAEGPATIQTEVSTATPPVITTVVFTDSPVVVTTVTTSLLCTCDQAAEVGMDSNEGSFSKRGG